MQLCLLGMYIFRPYFFALPYFSVNSWRRTRLVCQSDITVAIAVLIPGICITINFLVPGTYYVMIEVGIM